MAVGTLTPPPPSIIIYHHHSGIIIITQAFSVVAESELLIGAWASALERRGGGGEIDAVSPSCRIRRRPGLGLEGRLVLDEHVQQDLLLLRNKAATDSTSLFGVSAGRRGGEGGGIVQPRLRHEPRRWNNDAIGGEDDVAPGHFDLALWRACACRWWARREMR